MLSLSDALRPRVCLVPTPSGDSDRGIAAFRGLLRKRGAVLGGVSAGATCPFESCVTNSFGPGLAALHDGLGLLPGSFCPHYDGEELRRPVYRRLVDGGFPAGYAADDGAAFHFAEAEMREVVSSRPGARGYRVESGAETPIPARALL